MNGLYAQNLEKQKGPHFVQQFPKKKQPQNIQDQ
jgi:hypothetical protein